MVQIRGAAIYVNSLLSAYIPIHNDVFGANIRHLIPIPGIFKKINYCQHRESLAQISSQLQLRQAEAVKAASEGGGQAHLASVLAEYIRALNVTVTQLQGMSDLLCRKAQGEHSYSMYAYNRDCERYNKLVEQYRQIGNSLNEVMRGW